MIYLDNAATTLKKPPCVAEAVVRAMATMGNSGRSAHQEALDASRVIYRTREQLAKLLGCSAAERVVFTCNSTEALNIAIDGLFAPGDHVLSTDCEHNSVLRPLYRLAGVSVAAMAVCVALVYLIVVRLSRRAMEPVVQSVQRQKQFITDAGHELKTPITVIATSLRLLEMEVGQQKWLEKAQNQTERLKELVNSLVTLSRMDEEESPLKLSDFAVSEAVEETAESFRDFARSQGHLLELAIVPGLTYCGDEYAVRQLVSILLDNAVKYALPETPIRFVLEKGKRGVVLRCSNACTPLAEGETEKLFDRFYRSDQARSADGSFGVGLSIARSIAEGHHGFIRAQCPQPGEIVFTAQLR